MTKQQMIDKLGGYLRAKGERDRILNILENLADDADAESYRQRMEKVANDLKREMHRVEDIIETVPRPVDRSILRYRYILGYRYEDIGDKVHYSPRQCQRFHDRAVRELI